MAQVLLSTLGLGGGTGRYMGCGQTRRKPIFRFFFPRSLQGNWNESTGPAKKPSYCAISLLESTLTLRVLDSRSSSGSAAALVRHRSGLDGNFVVLGPERCAGSGFGLRQSGKHGIAEHLVDFRSQRGGGRIRPELFGDRLFSREYKPWRGGYRS